MKNNSTLTPNNKPMSTFSKFSLVINIFNILYCTFLFGMISGGARLPIWPFLIMMIISISVAIEAFISLKK